MKLIKTLQKKSITYYRKLRHFISRHPPKRIDQSERILRGIFDKSHYRQRELKVKMSLFTPPKDKGVGDSGISVMRLDYSTPDKCKFHCLHISNGNRNYLGFACLNPEIVRRASHESWKADVISTPIYNNAYPFSEHADVVYYNDGDLYVRTEKEVMPPEIKILAEQFLDQIVCYIDPDPSKLPCQNFVYTV